MQIESQGMSGFQTGSALALSLDSSSIIQKVCSAKEARALPRGSVIGDLHGGLTFTDAVATVLESRSAGGWQEWKNHSG
ncbi:MAG: hypothetical protein JOZ22_24200, partial [Acidobacteriia bacterium]|nr:hypothetical protein [Terriglobia bacterium]